MTTPRFVRTPHIGPPKMPLPDRLPSVVTDRLVRLIRLIGDMQLHCVIRLEGRLDEVRLARAVRLLLDTEPVLGCRWVETRLHPRWERRQDLDRAPLVSVVDSDAPLADCSPFMTMPCLAERDPLVQVRIFRPPPGADGAVAGDTVCVKLAHLAMDGGGTKECVYRLASIYEALGRDRGFRPRANLTGRRSFDQILERLGPWGRLGMVRYGLWSTRRRIRPARWWAFPSEDGRRGRLAPGPSYVFHRIGADRFGAVRAYCGRQGVTLNDVLVAAYCQAVVELVRPAAEVPLRLRTTVDLRRYLPSGRGEALCNLSAFVYPNLGPGLPRSFDELVGRVHREMNRHKADLIGLGDYPFFGVLATMMPFWGLLTGFEAHLAKPLPAELRLPAITNIGRVDPAQLRFGEPRVVDAFVTASVVYPPLFAPAITGFGDSLTFSAGFCDSAIPRARVEGLFDRMERLLPS